VCVYISEEAIRAWIRTTRGALVGSGCEVLGAGRAWVVW